MKKLLLVLIAILFLTPSVYAMSCETSQSWGSGDTCWVEVQISPYETQSDGNGLSKGTVFVYDYANGVAATGAWQVLAHRNNSMDTARIAGVAQTQVKSGQTVKLLVRGYGDINVTAENVPIVSGDTLKIGKTIGFASADQNQLDTNTTHRSIGVALENATAKGRIKAYIKV